MPTEKPQVKDSFKQQQMPTEKPLVKDSFKQQDMPTEKPPVKDFKQQDEGGVAIIGIGCRFPGGVESADDLWQFSCSHGDGIIPVPSDRWNAQLTSDPDKGVKGVSHCDKGGFLNKGVLDFDPTFFGISNLEAEQLDPQQRLLLTATWEALEDGGITLEKLKGSNTGVFIGSFNTDSVNIVAEDVSKITSNTAMAASQTMLSARVAHFLDVNGPCLSVDTACSSSLVATHLAVSSILNGESSMAIAGGVSIMIHTCLSAVLSKGGYLAPDGHCKTFSDLADGYGRSEGCGVVILKRLEEARKDNNEILAVIRSSGINSDGQTVGIATPSGSAQEKLFRATLAKANIQPAKIRYVEAHGTGTKVGDKIETKTLSNVYGKCDRSEPCYVGSVKANIGHCEGAAGVAGLIRATMAVKKRKIPPHSMLRGNISKEISIGSDYGLLLSSETKKVNEGEDFFVAVNSFGYGGTNCQIILSVEPETALAKQTDMSYGIPLEKLQRQLLFPFSAKSSSSLSALAKKMADYISQQTDLDGKMARLWLERVQRALIYHRSQLSHRAVLRAASVKELKQGLLSLSSQDIDDGDLVLARGKVGTVSGRANVVWLFTGMGPQWWAMGKDLFESESTFRAGVIEANEAYIRAGGLSILPEMFKSSLEESDMHRNDVSQPANFLVQIGLLKMLQERAGKPFAIVGHSVGEVAAAVAADCLTLDAAAAVVFARSSLQQRVAGRGGMLAIGLSELKAKELLESTGVDSQVDIAALNSAEMVTLSGESSSLNKVQENVDASVFCAKMRVEVAYHGRQMEMEGIEDGLYQMLGKSLQDISRPTIPLYSTVTGSKVTGVVHHPRYWWQNMRQPVDLQGALKHVLADGGNVFLEIGPHPVLGGSVQAVAMESKTKVSVETLFTMKRKSEETKTFDQAIAGLFVHGASISLSMDEHLQFISDKKWQNNIPRTVWETQTFCPRHRFSTDSIRRPGALLDMSVPASIAWRSRFDFSRYSWLKDHVVEGQAILPGAAHIEIGLEAAFFFRAPSIESIADLKNAIDPDNPFLIADVNFLSPMPVRNKNSMGEPNRVEMQVSFNPRTRNQYVISGRDGDESSPWTSFSVGRVPDPSIKYYAGRSATKNLDLNIKNFGLMNVESSLSTSEGSQEIVERTIDPSEFYQTLAGVGLSYGPTFQCVKSLKLYGGRLAIARLTGGSIDPTENIPNYVLHPGVLDSTFQIISKMIEIEAGFAPASPWLPTSAKRVLAYSIGQCDVIGVVKLKQLEQAFARIDVELFNPIDGAIVAEVQGLQCEMVPKTNSPLESANLSLASCLYTVAWDQQEVPHRQDKELEPLQYEVFGGLTGNGFNGSGKRGIVLFPAYQYAGGDLFNLIESLVTCTRQAIAREQKVCILTKSAVQVNETDTVQHVSPLSASVWGFARVLFSEQPALEARLIDLDFEPDASDIVSLISAAESINLNQLAYRRSLNGMWCSPRMTHHWLDGSDVTEFIPSHIDKTDYGLISRIPLHENPMKITVLQPGDLSSIFCEPILGKRAVREDEVRVEVHFASLNFKDCLKALGKLDHKATRGTLTGSSMGIDCSGIVIECGSAVTSLKPGDRVMSPGVESNLGSHICEKAHHCGKVPDSISLETGSCCLVYYTAYYALVTIGRVQKGETILIHQATGGVGLSAIQIAKHLGANIIATAGTAEKRLYLKEQLGLEHVHDSRTLNWVDACHEITGGRGVDAILSALSGEGIEAGLDALAVQGRYLEIGKRDIASGQPMSMAPFGKSISFSSIDIDVLVKQLGKPFYVQMLEDILHILETGMVTPLPSQLFKAADAASAFSMLAQAKHIGKVIIDWRKDGQEAVPVQVTSAPALLRKERTYIVTGGLSGFGLEVAHFLLENGAGVLILLSRSGKAKTETDRARLDQMMQVYTGRVFTRSVDISDGDSVASVFKEIKTIELFPPIGGIFHSATVYEDAAVVSVTREQIRAGLSAKALGALNLDSACRGIETLEHFCLFSSVSNMLGNQFQSVYAAANALLEGLATRRRQQGLPGLAVAWGSLSAGFVKRNEAIREHLASKGLPPMPMSLAMKILKFLMSRPGANSNPSTMASLMDFEVLTTSTQNLKIYPQWDFLYSEFRQKRSATSLSQKTPIDRLMHELAIDRNQAMNRITGKLVGSVASVLRMESIDENAVIRELGVDSMVAVNISAKVQRQIGVRLSVMQFLGNQTIASLAESIASELDKRRDYVVP